MAAQPFSTTAGLSVVGLLQRGVGSEGRSTIAIGLDAGSCTPSEELLGLDGHLVHAVAQALETLDGAPGLLDPFGVLQKKRPGPLVLAGLFLVGASICLGSNAARAASIEGLQEGEPFSLARVEARPEVRVHECLVDGASQLIELFAVRSPQLEPVIREHRGVSASERDQRRDDGRVCEAVQVAALLFLLLIYVLGIWTFGSLVYKHITAPLDRWGRARWSWWTLGGRR